jgi:hypothetical protein
MNNPNRMQFTRRNNPDGTIDSVCRQCCTTVALENQEPTVFQREHEHTCDLALSQRKSSVVFTPLHIRS